MNVLKRFLLSFMLMLTCTILYAQTEITGTVVDETGETVIGATVVEKGTSNGTVTDFDGNFVIKVNPGATLVVSYIGYEKMEVVAENGMTITLKDNAVELKELVVTGYQVQRKADLTGAVAVMDMKGPISESDPNMLNSMQGKLSGVDIVTDAAPGGGSSTIRVRGMSTVNACDPLYVIDGVATNENLNSLNSADIESIQVLKDASSASIYGSRAANGVIIITTKKGKEGRMAINVNYNAALQTVVKTFDVLNAAQWGLLAGRQERRHRPHGSCRPVWQRCNATAGEQHQRHQHRRHRLAEGRLQQCLDPQHLGQHLQCQREGFLPVLGQLHQPERSDGPYVLQAPERSCELDLQFQPVHSCG